MKAARKSLIAMAVLVPLTFGARAPGEQPNVQDQAATATEKQNTHMTTKELLDTYYKGFAQKAGWESVISDDFKFIGGDMTKRDPIVGKAAYIGVIKRFSQLFTAMRVKDTMVAGDRAYVLANYDYVFPGGKNINGDVVELWRVKDGKLDELTIFFDTLTFERLTKPPPKA